MERLPAEYREVLLLREVEDLPYKDIAEVTGVPIGTVMSRLSRARLALRQLWLGTETTEAGAWRMTALRRLVPLLADGELGPAAPLPGLAPRRALPRLRGGTGGIAGDADRRSAPACRIHRAPPGLAARIGASLPREDAPAGRGHGPGSARRHWVLPAPAWPARWLVWR